MSIEHNAIETSANDNHIHDINTSTVLPTSANTDCNGSIPTIASCEVTVHASVSSLSSTDYVANNVNIHSSDVIKGRHCITYIVYINNALLT